MIGDRAIVAKAQGDGLTGANEIVQLVGGRPAPTGDPFGGRLYAFHQGHGSGLAL
jgi:hypothetical protein